jgi:hypothetical protein|tara:strand:+ start:524 stop:814 length:291 start_codon:yes stop_codon:yes gene_type:complete
MFIETPMKFGDIVSFKLNSGEELVARLDGESSTEYTLYKPMVLIMQQQGLGLAPFMFGVSPDAKFELQTHAVSCRAKTEDEISKQYTAATSNIQIQ